MIPVVLIVVITVVDILVPADVHLGPLLIIASAISASFAGPLLTGVIEVLAVAAQAFFGWHFGVLFSRNVMVQVLALAVLSSLIVFFCVVRKQHRRRPAQVRSVAEAAQHALLWPLPDRPGPMQVACLYLAAEDEARIGGDLYAAPPLGLGSGPADCTLDLFSFEAGDTLLLHTDGVVEARDQDGTFYLFTERAAQWTDNTPETLLHLLRRDLLAPTGGRLDDDAALIAIRRMHTRHAGRHHGKPVPRASELRSWNQM
ncbi:SpoIIE family protein phosphatase [Streptomyces sp. NPDC002619]|uniref:SpoIIE family protein phosphatase n=1 Tax=Streptomyces sp. NPDC002619 TaxID=3364655 RepID=UPI00368A38B7